MLNCASASGRILSLPFFESQWIDDVRSEEFVEQFHRNIVHIHSSVIEATLSHSLLYSISVSSVDSNPRESVIENTRSEFVIFATSCSDTGRSRANRIIDRRLNTVTQDRVCFASNVNFSISSVDGSLCTLDIYHVSDKSFAAGLTSIVESVTESSNKCSRTDFTEQIWFLTQTCFKKTDSSTSFETIGRTLLLWFWESILTIL